MLNDKQSKIINTLRILSGGIPELISELEEEFATQNNHISHIESETDRVKEALKHIGSELMNL